MTSHGRPRVTALAILGPLVLAACVSPQISPIDPASASPPSAATAAPTSGLPALPISISHPSPGAARALAACHVGDQFSRAQVVGAGEIALAGDVWHYVPLTGREPILATAGPVWVIQLRAAVPQPGGGGVWTDPTCIVTNEDAGFLATGPITDNSGTVHEPLTPAKVPDRRLPPLAP
jgi:hypothetical protein